MDNRRVFNSYRNRINSSSSSSARSRGILSKVKGFFNNVASNTSSNDLASTTSTEDQTSHKNTVNNHAFKLPGSFDTSFANETVVNAGIDPAGDVQSSPNKLLSDFFKEKGDKPLTKIEYEGVLSLIAKSKATASGQPADTTITSHNTNNHNEIDSTTMLNDKSLLIHPSNVTQNNSILLDSPKQRYLKRNNHEDTSIIETPEYTPVYHTFANNSFNNSFSGANKTMPSIKRVYQFSGLPSPYRTRIRVPSTSSTSLRPSVKRQKKKSTTNAAEDTSSMVNNTFREKNYKPYKPRSEAANTLLSILDGKLTYTQKDETTESKTDLEPKSEEVKVPIINESSNTNNNNANVNGISITAKDIAKTILFDKSQPLVADKQNEENNGDNKGKISNGSVASSWSFKPASTSGDSNSKVDSQPFKFSLETKSNETKTNTKPFDLNPSGSKVNSQPQSQSQPQPGKLPQFSFEKRADIKASNGESFNTQPSPSVKPSNFTFSTTSSLGVTGAATHKESDSFFKFPDVEIVNVQLDQSKVDTYKGLFEF